METNLHYVEYDYDLDTENKIEYIQVQDSNQEYDGYQLMGILGQGNFGTVYKAQNLATKKIVALKVIRIQNEQMLKLVQREVEILTRISAPECKSNLACFNSSKYLNRSHEYLIEMEFIEGPNLKDLVFNLSSDENELLYYLYKILLGVKHIHQAGIIHNDLKPDNILMRNFDEPVIVDFGISCLVECDITQCKCNYIIGPNLYVSPETIKTKKYYFESDIWSLGVTFFYLATKGYYPFSIQGLDISQIFKLIEQTQPQKLRTNNEVLNHLVNRMLRPLNQRISVDEMLKILSEYLF